MKRLHQSEWFAIVLIAIVIVVIGIDRVPSALNRLYLSSTTILRLEVLPPIPSINNVSAPSPTRWGATVTMTVNGSQFGRNDRGILSMYVTAVQLQCPPGLTINASSFNVLSAEQINATFQIPQGVSDGYCDLYVTNGSQTPGTYAQALSIRFSGGDSGGPSSGSASITTKRNNSGSSLFSSAPVAMNAPATNPIPSLTNQTDSSTTKSRTLAIGDRGNEVHDIQEALIELGYLTIAQPTGYFGKLTSDAIKRYQKIRDISKNPNGIVNATTKILLEGDRIMANNMQLQKNRQIEAKQLPQTMRVPIQAETSQPSQKAMETIPQTHQTNENLLSQKTPNVQKKPKPKNELIKKVSAFEQLKIRMRNLLRRSLDFIPTLFGSKTKKPRASNKSAGASAKDFIIPVKKVRDAALD